MSTEVRGIHEILVVDNDPAVLTFVSMLLTERDYTVRTAKDGLEALEVLRDFAPQAVFIDLIMPNIGGKKLCQIMRAKPEYNDTFLLVLSAISSEEEVDYAAIGFDACIAKGPLKKLGPHLISVLEKLGTEITRSRPGSTFGLEDLYKREITRELLSTKRHSELILNNMSESIVELTADRRMVFANPQALSLLGLPEERLLGGDFAEVFEGDQRQRIIAAAESAVQEPIWITDDNPLLLKERMLTMSALPVDDDGQISIVVIMSDITFKKHAAEELRKAHGDLEARVEARTRDLATANSSLQSEIAERTRLEQKQRISLEEKETLLNEIHHRVKNNLQIFSSLLGIYARRIGSGKFDWVVREMRDRVHSISLVHEKLYGSENLAAVDIGDYLRSLVSHLVHSYAEDASRVRTKVVADDVFLSIDQAVPCALIVNELITNSLKYAFSDGKVGQIIVAIRQIDATTCRMSVKDTGVGLPEDLDTGKADTLGLRIVKVLTKQLDGKLAVGRSGGTTFQVDFPTVE